VTAGAPPARSPPSGTLPARAPSAFAYATRGLGESQVWADVVSRSALRDLEEPARGLFRYALTELVNNAIDHSDAQEVEVLVAREGSQFAFEVVDRGIGIFERLRLGLSLGSALEALQELSKGKVTTQPDRHTGEGIFFSSKIADVFEIESGDLHWIIDNVQGDMAVLEVAPRAGTRVRFAADRAIARTLEATLSEYTDEDYAFHRTRVVVRLFNLDVRFVSRSEAKRLLHGLERFREVVLDFAGVQGIGQGFADEVFRVWARAHPETRLEPVRMLGPVAFMLERARRGEP
jgi:anti-sigma regulatory factor (Ser/Thr protein kinase)